MLYLTHDPSSSESIARPASIVDWPDDLLPAEPLPPDPNKRVFQLMVPPAHPVETIFRHSCWSAKRAKVRAMLELTCLSKYAMNRFDQCGSECTIEYSPEAKKHRLRANYCKSRHCEPCMRAKANKLAAALKNKLEDAKTHQYRFVTLTLKHSATPLADQIKRLYASFRKLRTNKVWSTTQRGGAVLLEVKYKPDTKRWHPHLHIIAEGGFLDKYDLSSAWHSATGDSQIIDIRALKSAKDAAHYVCKYVTKGTSNTVWESTAAATEWITASRGVRTCATFGTWRGYKLTTQPPRYTDWQPVQSLKSLAAEVSSGDGIAIVLWCKLDGTGLDDELTKSISSLRKKE